MIRYNRLWKGATANNTDMVFGVPKGAKVSEADRLKAAQLGYPSDDHYDYTRLGNPCWFTTIDHGRRHGALQLMSEADNIRYSKHKEIRGAGYRRYDNYDAIEVPFVDAIPSDYNGIMGVPITYLDKHDPDQFTIHFGSHDMAEAARFGIEPLGDQRVADYYAAGGTGSLSRGHRKPFLYEPRPHVPFQRMFIRRKDHS